MVHLLAYFGGSRYFGGHRIPRKELEAKGRNVHIDVVQTIVLESSSNVNGLDIMGVTIFQNIERGPELIIDYGSLWEFPLHGELEQRRCKTKAKCHYLYIFTRFKEKICRM